MKNCDPNFNLCIYVQSIFYDKHAVYVLEQECKENRSISNAVELKNARHWLYNQRTNFCLKDCPHENIMVAVLFSSIT